ncbi:hypothetical protein FHR89_002873 [Cellulomonas uda]|nr:hypothetical protein [Cellulomonas uda]
MARELKYFSPETNYRALEQELASRNHDPVDRRGVAALDTEDEPPEDYRRWLDDER